MNRIRILSAFAVLAAGMAFNAQAAFVTGLTLAPQDVRVDAPVLLYDHNGLNATTGTLTIIAPAGSTSTLKEGVAAGNGTASQLYSAYTTMATLNINNTTGAVIGGTITISVGATATKFSWTGTATGGGFNPANVQTLLNGTWNVTADTYTGLPSGAAATAMNQFVNGWLSGGSGGFIISTAGGTFTLANAVFGSDWLVGATAASIGAGYTANVTLNAANTFATTTVGVDFAATPVPLPAALWGMIGGLGMLSRAARRRA